MGKYTVICTVSNVVDVVIVASKTYGDNAFFKPTIKSCKVLTAFFPRTPCHQPQHLMESAGPRYQTNVNEAPDPPML